MEACLVADVHFERDTSWGGEPSQYWRPMREDKERAGAILGQVARALGFYRDRHCSDGNIMEYLSHSGRCPEDIMDRIHALLDKFPPPLSAH